MIGVHRARVFLVFVLAVSAVGCGREGHESGRATSQAPVKAVLMAVAKKPIPLAYEAMGTVRSKTSSVIQSKATGNVLTVAFKEGDIVEAGRVLIKLDDREAVAMLQKASSALDATQKSVGEAEQAVRASEAAKRVAEAQQTLATATYERFKNLLASSAVSKQAFDEAEAKSRSAAAEATRAAETMKSYEARQAEVLARVEQAKAEVENARVMLDHTEVKAPYAGVVTRKHVNVGDMASPGQPLLEMEDNAHYRLEVQVDEMRAVSIHVGDAAEIAFDGTSQSPISGVVDEITSAADTTTRTFNVKVAAPDGMALRSGTFGRARFNAGQQDAIVVPASAIVERGQLTSVFAVDESSVARMRLVKTGRRLGNDVEILSGLNEGDTVVMTPSAEIRDGVRVEAP